MVSYKLDKYDKYFVAFILVILVIFNVSQCFAVEGEELSFTSAGNIMIDPNNNYFTSSQYEITGYLLMEKGYIYHVFVPDSFSLPRNVAVSNVAPAVNVRYEFLSTIQPGGSYNYICDNDQYLYFSLSSYNDGVVVTREKVENMNGAIGDLVSNVGVNQLWSVFESGIDFAGVVVLVAFGLFLIVLLIKKLSKGKSDF